MVDSFKNQNTNCFTGVTKETMDYYSILESKILCNIWYYGISHFHAMRRGTVSFNWIQRILWEDANRCKSNWVSRRGSSTANTASQQNGMRQGGDCQEETATVDRFGERYTASNPVNCQLLFLSQKRNFLRECFCWSKVLISRVCHCLAALGSGIGLVT